jgi:hypothetical protein
MPEWGRIDEWPVGITIAPGWAGVLALDDKEKTPGNQFPAFSFL